MRHISQIGALALVLACGTDSTAPEPKQERTGITLDILRAEAGGVRGEGKHLPWADLAAEFDVRGRTVGGFPGRMYAETLVSFGINEHPVAKSWVYSGWSSEAGDYRVATDVNWKGHFSGIGVAGTGAKMTFVLKILDFRGNLLATEMLHEREVRETALTVGAIKDEGSTSAVVDFTLPPNTGGPFRIQFEVTCESYSGFVSTNASCLFGKTPALVSVGLGGYAEWTKLTVTSFSK